MAEKVGAEDTTKRRGSPPKNHNQADLAKKLEPFIKDINKAYDAMEEDHGSHVLTITNKFDKIAETIGYPKAMIRSQVAKIRRGIKLEQQLKEAKLDELEEEVALLEGFAGTGFGRFVQERLEKLRAAVKTKD